jgi:hypothetical protein
MRLIDQLRLEEEAARFQATVDALILRLEHTLIALALTFDAQAATWQRLNGNHGGPGSLDATVGALQRAAEQYRMLARNLPGRTGPRGS